MSSAALKSRRDKGVRGSAAASIVVSSTVSQPWRLGQAAVCPCARVCYGEIGVAMEIDDIKVTQRSNPSQRIIALGIVFGFLYLASNIVITLMLAVLLAYFLDPVVGALERIYIPRALGALLVLLAVTAMVTGLGYLAADRADQFLNGWPRYSEILRSVTTAFDMKIS